MIIIIITLTHRSVVGRVTCVLIKEYSNFRFLRTIEKSQVAILSQVSTYTRSNSRHLHWFPYSRILVRGWEQPFTLPSPHSSFFSIFFFRYQTHHYLWERIHFLWSNCVLFNYLIRKYLYIKTWDILSHPNYHYLYLIIMQLWYNGIVTAMSLHPFLFFFSFTSSRNK